jgi:hypothetical protein
MRCVSGSGGSLLRILLPQTDGWMRQRQQQPGSSSDSDHFTSTRLMGGCSSAAVGQETTIVAIELLSQKTIKMIVSGVKVRSQHVDTST